MAACKNAITSAAVNMKGSGTGVVRPTPPPQLCQLLAISSVALSKSCISDIVRLQD